MSRARPPHSRLGLEWDVTRQRTPREPLGRGTGWAHVTMVQCHDPCFGEQAEEWAR